MMFSELYGIYYQTAAHILDEAVSRSKAGAPPLNTKEIREIIRQNGLGEGGLLIEDALSSQKWQLLHQDGTAPLQREPAMPLTTLEKRWMKAIAMDPRMRLFGEDLSPILNDQTIQPLFTPEDIVLFDRYDDGDPFEESQYIEHFRLILDAIKNHQLLFIEMEGRTGKKRNLITMPERLEYSEKDDKFRLIGSGRRQKDTINLGRILSCSLCDNPEVILQQANFHQSWQSRSGQSLQPSKQKVELVLTDERNALERVMLHFAHYEKEAVKLDRKNYQLTITYEKDDETEILIRILSFGPMVRVTGPNRFVRLIRERLERQGNLTEK